MVKKLLTRERERWFERTKVMAVIDTIMVKENWRREQNGQAPMYFDFQRTLQRKANHNVNPRKARRKEGFRR